MKTTRRTVLGGLASAVPLAKANAWLATFGGGAPPPPSNLPLVRTLNNYGTANNNTLSSSFVIFGHPFVKGEVPSGQIVTGAIGASSVRLQDISCNAAGTVSNPLLESDGSLRWSLMVADLTGISIAANSNADLQLTATADSWSATTGRSNPDWINLVDTVQITSLATTGTPAADMDGAGIWTASFNTASSPNIVDILGSSALCYAVRVRAPFKNGATTHRFLVAWMYYFVMQLSNGSLGPIASLGPFIENTQGFKTNPSEFDYDLNFLRNGVSQRIQTGVKQAFFTFAALCRPDGRYDWTANDPTIWISQAYSESRKTKKLPPFFSGITYNPAVGSQPTNLVSSISSGVFTVPSAGANIFGAGHNPVAVRFEATSMPAGGQIAANIAYWARYASSTTFTLYDSMTHATAGGGTGQISPSGAFTALVAKLAVAPMTPGCFDQDMTAGGSRPDISLMTEWGSAYHIGNTRDQQDMGRAQAYAMAGVPEWLTDDATGLIPGLISTPNATPVGMTQTDTTRWGQGTFSSNIGGGAGPTGGLNNWIPSDAHFPDPVYAVWVTEGNPFLRDLVIYSGNRTMGMIGYLPRRNCVVAGITYSGNSCYCYDGQQSRLGAWNLRNLTEAAVVAPEGSLYQTYFRNALKNNGAFGIAYTTYQGANYANLGWVGYLQNDYPPATAQAGGPEEGFMQTFMSLACAWSSMLCGDFVPDLNTMAVQSNKWLVGLYNTAACNYWATMYSFSISPTEANGAQPSVVVSSFDAIGMGPTQDLFFSYVNGSQNITWSGFTMPGTGFWTLAAGDKFRPQNYTSLDRSPGSRPVAPSPLVDGTDYLILSVNTGAQTFHVGTVAGGLGGTPITMGATVNNSGGVLLPTGQSCPATGTMVNNAGGTTDTNSYLVAQLAALSIHAVLGHTGAATALAAVNTRWVGNAGFAQECAWAMQGTL